MSKRIMFIIVFILMIWCVLCLYLVHNLDPWTVFNMTVKTEDPSSIQTISEEYVQLLGVKLDKKVVYRFVEFNANKHANKSEILLGTFHQWEDTYYIDISIDISTNYNEFDFIDTVVHETRHMLVMCLKNNNVIDLVQYSEIIAQAKDADYNRLFNTSIKLLRDKQL